MLNSVGEFGLIDLISKKIKSKDVVVGIGDDCAVVKHKKEFLLYTTDCHVEGVHSDLRWFSFKQVGMKAIEANASDIYAMGGIARFALVSLVLPKSLEVSSVKEMYKGMRVSGKKHSVEIIGGNITSGKQLSISVTMIGSCSKPVLRSTAKPGDLIFVNASLGNGHAGLRLLQKKKKGFDILKKAHVLPKTKSVDCPASSMIDISDGLVSDLSHICKSSGCGAVLFSSNIPLSESVKEAALLLGEDPLSYALFGGEEFCMLYTVSPKDLDSAEGYLIGEITSKKGIRLYDEGKEKLIKKRGYEHFRE